MNREEGPGSRLRRMLKRKAMGKILLCAALLIAFTTDSPAQIPAPGAEIFGGYSYTRANFSNVGLNASGWEGSLTGNFNRTFGLEADFTHTYDVPHPSFTFLFGPHFAFRAIARVNPFVHFLVGGTRSRQRLVGMLPPQTETALAAAAGFGLDVKATRFIWIRAAQVDYVRQFFSNNGQDNIRVSAGVVFRFGS